LLRPVHDDLVTAPLPGPVALAGTPVVALWTGASHGDQRGVLESGAPAPREVPTDLTVVGVRQVHGHDVVAVGVGANAVVDGEADAPNTRTTGRAVSDELRAEGDAVLATDDETCVAVLVADCLPIAIGSPEGVRVAVHAGWRGLVSGVIGNAAKAARDAGASRLIAALGPCIGPCCYEFSGSELAVVAAKLGPEMLATTRVGTPALDLRAVAYRALRSVGARIVFEVDSCTACDGGWFSARAQCCEERQAMYLWRERPGRSVGSVLPSS
jgi:YfiH family protein